MDEIGLFFSTKGRIDRKTFAWCALAVYVAGFFSQSLLAGSVIERLRDADEGPAGAIGVAIIYALAISLLLLIVALFTGLGAGSHADRPPGESAAPGDAALGLFLVILIFGLLFSPDFGVFTTLLKILLVIACLPALISFGFSLRTGLRKSVPPG
jgi:biotin transporter BioY